ncbi:sugar transferase [Marinomonas communis]|uniref:Lipopolysaccharide/colanic/teichoic acid biosynthesis glycosyltransferase n=1 Tax=Marinomonas communis TaxID=28254 RepID=A0A4R6X2J3_9GAMM|nr:sugar transferase [Marinomonas communis]TDR13086.1 lipopolysaccharide/colanic/teichoic acid biosynthesis glycosyltransferase [Marinomonas communis]
MLKRLFDILCAALGLAAMLPVLVLIAIWIKLDSPGPVFFRQVRVGRFGIPFGIHKFRTMRVNAEQEGRLTVGRDSRITRSGHLLRKTKLDELPQLIDVLIGKMSLVGPRPEVQEFIDCYPDDIKAKVLSVRPGITDRASIEMMDENEILSKYSDAEKAYIEHILPLKQKYYIDYVNNNSLFTDVFIIFKTIYKIIKR